MSSLGSLACLCACALAVPAAAQGCMSFKDKDSCLDCVSSTDAHGHASCKMTGMSMGMDMCEGRDPCLSCEWTMNMCMPKKGGGGGMGGMGGMQMSFYSGTDVTIMFDAWTTRDGGMYALALMLVCAGSFLMMVMKHYLSVGATRLSLAVRAPLAFLFFNLSYAVMLVAMTYNVGLWFATMCGLTLGYVVTGMPTLAERQLRALLAAGAVGTLCLVLLLRADRTLRLPV